MTVVFVDPLSLPQFTTAALPSNTPAGKLAWDTTRAAVVYSTGTAWVVVGSGASSGSRAFDFMMGE